MLLDLKKLFTKGTSLGRCEYIKLILGLSPIPSIAVFLAIITQPNSLLCYIFITLAIIINVAYLIIYLVATYKRITNIFNNTIASVISMIVYILGGIVQLLNIIFNILLIVIPGRKKSDYVISNKLLWIAIPYIVIMLMVSRYNGFLKLIPGEGMANTILSGDRVVVNIFNRNCKRGDIVIFKYKVDAKSIIYIKRIIALPREKVEIRTLKDGAKYIYINDKLLKEPYVKDVHDYLECSTDIKCEPMIVPENNYYVLGDNRGNSFDSRFYGTIDKSDIKGKVSHIWYPLNRRQVFPNIKYSLDD